MQLLYGSDSDNTKLTVSLVDPVWELVDPAPDVHALFCTYNDQFFWGQLHTVSVSWSPRMTVCAGVCSYEGRGGLCSIRLSVPLLKLRPRSDLVETLLHEMIHAYLFVTANNRDREGHGPEFHKHMHRINAKARTRISVYHSFHDEVAVYRQHVWQCSGPCRHRRPYYGLVKRSMNRAPGPYDRWWANHQRSCGGSYTKIREPEGYANKGVKRKATDSLNESEVKRNAKAPLPAADIRQYFTGAGKSLTVASGVTRKLPSTDAKMPSTSSVKMPKDDHLAAGNLGKSQAKLPNSDQFTANKNIRGFSSTASGVVKSVEVGNASRSKIVGFDKGLNKNSNAQKNIAGKSLGASFTDKKSGGGLTFGSGGTFVLNPRTTTTTTDRKEAEEVKARNLGNGLAVSSTGTGFKLSNGNVESTVPESGRPVSRLLLEYDARMAAHNALRESNTRAIASKKGNQGDPRTSSSRGCSAQLPTQGNCTTPSEISENKFSKSSKYSLSDSDEDCDTTKTCPLCQASISSNEFISHISVCMGDWGESENLLVEDLPLVSALSDLDAREINMNETFEDHKSTSGDNECNEPITNIPTESHKNITSATTKKIRESHLTGANSVSTQKIVDSSKPLRNIASRDVVKRNSSNDLTHDEDFVCVSDSDDEFDVRYWERPVMSVVQLSGNLAILDIATRDAATLNIATTLPAGTHSNAKTTASNYLGTEITSGPGTSMDPFGGPRAGVSSGSGISGAGASLVDGLENRDFETCMKKKDVGSAAKYPCPVCGELFTEDYITNTHIDTHFG
ncbi:DNA-dependent metalloprotease SPRTN isoform X2 [Hyalella azteca]|uniref:DNA-dependent metalloprotease SPRTN isoform X2 n=1 Tax=Hyalella azteca TaxID=294128 RepID=A0A979FHM8_HYAAZ|nr:DNA-dependent metalloprotease SPRTN isoform X2 [Hyalella azteca]